eukprot:gene1094-10611_t
MLLMPDSGFLSSGEKSSEGKSARDKLKKEFKYESKITIDELKKSIISDLNEIKKYLDESSKKFKVDGVIFGYKSIIEKREKEFERMLPSSTPSSPNKKPNISPLPIDPDDKKKIEKMIENPEMKAQIIDKIMKAFPSFKKEQLDSLSVKDLLEISITLGFDFSNLNRLKAPENATKEVKELAQNLENLKREREIQEEFSRLKNRIQGEESMTNKEKKEKLLSDAAEIIKENLRDKKSAKKSSQISKLVKTPKPKINQIEEKYIESIKKSKPKGKIQLNEQQVLGLGFSLEQNLDLIKNSDIGLTPATETLKKKSNPSSVKSEISRKENPFLLFMKEFRKENAGKFDAKTMMKEGAKAYKEQKNGGCSQIEPSQCKPKKKSKISTYNYDHVFVKEEAKKPDISIQLNQSKVEKDYTNKKGFEKLAEGYKKYIESQKY